MNFQGSTSLLVIPYVQCINFFSDYPRRHGVDIGSDDVAPHTVGFQQWNSTPHEWVGHRLSLKAIAVVKTIYYGFISEFGKY